MAGLLDFMNTDDAKLGIALLGAGGYSSTPMSFGQRLGGAMQGFNADRTATEDRAMRKMLMKSQIDENTSQADQRKAAIAKQQVIQSQTAGLLGDFSGAAPSEALPGSLPPGAAGLRGVPLERIAALKASGGPDLVEAWKVANVATSLSAGGYAQIPGQPLQYLADPTKGVGMQNGRVGLLPGAVESQAALAGATAGATAQAQANWQPEKVLGPNGETVLKPRAEVLQPASGGYRTEPQMKATATGDMGANAASLKRELFNAEADLKKPLDANSKAALQQHVADIRDRLTRVGSEQTATPSSLTAGNVVELSPAQQADNEAARARKVDTAKADVVRDTGKTAEAKRGAQIGQISGLAAQLLDKNPTASGVGSLVDSAANFVGQPLKGGTVAQQLEALSGWMVSNVPRMEGPQSNVDVLNYQTMAGRVGDRTLPVEARKAALGTLMELQKKYADVGSESTAPNPAKPAKVLESLPTPNASNKGQRIRDTTTGKVLVSNGMQWKEE